jgi:hypothetical protein
VEEGWLNPWRKRGGGLLEPPWSKGSDYMEWRGRITATATKKKRCAVEIAMRNEESMQSFFSFYCITIARFSWTAVLSVCRPDRMDVVVLSLPKL